MELTAFLQPGAATEVLFDIEQLEKAHRGRLEFSLVQEGVRWLHENGMPVGILHLPAQ